LLRHDVIRRKTRRTTECEELATLWHQAWHDAHAQIVPRELTRLRPVEHFRQRIEAALADARVVGPVGAPQGLCLIKGAQLYQLFVARAARGTGVAAALIDEAEARLERQGVETAWLACAIGNVRAARFYEKRGWHQTGTTVNAAETASGNFVLQVWRYEKTLARVGMT
jgi:GNAT superfamily N-acetyltransferase